MTTRPEIIQKQWALARQMQLIYGEAVHLQAGSVNKAVLSQQVCVLSAAEGCTTAQCKRCPAIHNQVL